MSHLARRAWLTVCFFFLAACLLLGSARASYAGGEGVPLPAFTAPVYGVLAFVLLTSVIALAYGFVLRAQVSRLSPGTPAMQEVGAAIRSGALGLPCQAGADDAAAGGDPGRPARLPLLRPVWPDTRPEHRGRLSSGRYALLHGRLRRHGHGGHRQPTDGEPSIDHLQGCLGDGLQERRGGGHDDGRAGAFGRDGDLPHFPQRRHEGADRLRVRRQPGRPVHARRRRHLHQVRRRRRGPRGQGGAVHSRRRPAQRGHHRRQRRGQRGRLRGHGRRRVRVVPRYPGRRPAAGRGGRGQNGKSCFYIAFDPVPAGHPRCRHPRLGRGRRLPARQGGHGPGPAGPHQPGLLADRGHRDGPTGGRGVPSAGAE